MDEGAGEFFASLDDQVPDRPSWFIIRVPESKAGKNQVHVDLTAADREAEVDRLIGLGATAGSDHDEWGVVWTTMRDPRGQRVLRAATSFVARPEVLGSVGAGG